MPCRLAAKCQGCSDKRGDGQMDKIGSMVHHSHKKRKRNSTAYRDLFFCFADQIRCESGYTVVGDIKLTRPYTRQHQSRAFGQGQ